MGEREETQEGRREGENGLPKWGGANGYNLSIPRSEMTKCRVRDWKIGPRILLRTFRTSTFYLSTFYLLSPNQECF